MSELGREPETLGLKCRFNMNPGCLTLENHSQTVLTAGMPGFIFFHVSVTYTTVQVANSTSRSGLVFSGLPRKKNLIFTLYS